MSRRRLLAATGAALPLTACSLVNSGGSPMDEVPLASGPRNVRDFGAVGDGRTDDTAAVARACAAADGGPVVLHLPAGQYVVHEWPELPDYSVLTGDGGDISTIVYPAGDTLWNLRDKHRISFRCLGAYATGERSTVAVLTNSFRCSFDTVVLRGNHLSGNQPRFFEQRGIVLEANTGGTTLVNCDINNFGVGISTACIQNYVTASKLASNHIGVLGVGDDHNAGLALTNVEFVSDTDPGTTLNHIRIEGAANDWWLTNVWFEGADVALSIGDRDRGGPAQFGMTNCKVAARTVCLDLVYCRQPYLANVQFDRDVAKYPKELRIDPAGCPEGTAVNLVSSADDDIDPRSFPAGWSVTGRRTAAGVAFVSPIVARAGTTDVPLLEAQAPDGAALSAVLPSGAWRSDRADGGVILRDQTGGYWRLTVGSDGQVRTAPLGSDRPLR